MQCAQWKVMIACLIKHRRLYEHFIASRNDSCNELRHQPRLVSLLGHSEVESCWGISKKDEFPSDLIQLKANFSQIMEAYSNCRQFNCVTPIVEQAEYHMFCREKAELYLPELYNKIGVGLMAWGPLSMSLPENSERLLFSTKGSLRNKSQSYSWTEDELNKEVKHWTTGKWTHKIENEFSVFRRIEWTKHEDIAKRYENLHFLLKNLAVLQPNFPSHGRWNMNLSSVCFSV